MVISLIKSKLLLAIIGHPTTMNGTIAGSDTVTSNGASPTSSTASLSSSSASMSVAQQQHVPTESPLRILQLKSEGVTEFLQEELRGFSMPEGA